MSLTRLLVDVQQADHFLHARDNRHLFRDGLVHALFAQDIAQVTLHLAPVLAHLLDYVDLLGEEVGSNLHRLGVQRHIQAVGQAVRDVGADDQCAVAKIRATDSRSRGCRCLADAAFA
jgi:hypothetical protein